MNQHSEPLPRPAEQLDKLVVYYDTHDTSNEMARGHWVEPQPMVTTSLRLPADLVADLKTEAERRGIRYTSYLRSLIEHAHPGGTSSELAEINQRLAHIEHTLADSHDHPRKSA